jgi:membrane fusion protein, multidrug efflux system
MKRKIKPVIYSLIAVIILLIILLPKFLSSDNPKAASPQGGPPGGNNPTFVKASVVDPELLREEIQTTGNVLADEEVDLRSEVSGKIVSISFNEGSRVNKGDLLVKINDAELQATLSRTNYRLKLLQDREYRSKQLLEKQAVSQEEYDIALNELNSQKAELDFIKAQIEKTEIRAPFSGVVGLKNVSEGSFINNSTIIASLQSISRVKIDFAVPEKYAGIIKTGNTVEFSVQGLNESFVAKIYAIEPKVDPVTRTLPIRAVYANTANKVIPGSFANIKVTIDNINNAVMIPSQALIPELEGQKVFLYKNGRAVPQNVETGIRTADRIQITEGLSAGDTVITTGILQIRPNAPVMISEID